LDPSDFERNSAGLKEEKADDLMSSRPLLFVRTPRPANSFRIAERLPEKQALGTVVFSQACHLWRNASSFHFPERLDNLRIADHPEVIDQTGIFLTSSRLLSS
jgi:hypothetical protein